MDGRGRDAARPALPPEDRHPHRRGHDRPARSTRSTSTPSSTSRPRRSSSTRSASATITIDRPDRRSTPTPTTATWAASSLIDRLTNATVGAGLLHFALRRSQNVHWQAVDVDARGRARALKGHGPASCGSPACPAPASRPSPTWSSSGCTRSASTPTCSTATTSATGSTSDLGFTEADRVENIRRVAEVAAADGRRRPHRAGLVHLAVPGRAPAGPRARRRRRVLRGLRRHAARGRRAARPQGPLRARPAEASSPTSPASTRPTRRRRNPSSTSRWSAPHRSISSSRCWNGSRRSSDADPDPPAH